MGSYFKYKQFHVSSWIRFYLFSSNIMDYLLIKPNQEAIKISFTELLSQHEKTLLYFYPKDNTPWCTMEAKEFSDAYEQFLKQDIAIVWVSKDSGKSHTNFIYNQGLKIPLISDESWVLHEQFGARGEKKNYGKVFLGTIRSTFLLNQKGEILQAWRNVKATGHVARVVKELGI